MQLGKTPALAAAVVVLTLASGCAKRVPKADLGALKEAVETYHRLLRWGDLRGAAQLVAPERRVELLERALREKDDENLKVMDYELEDAQVLGEKASVISKVSWMRQPSVTVRTEPVVFQWEARAGTWYIVSIRGGPLTLEAAPAAAPGAPGAAPEGAPPGP